jgi:hypothetical protein
LVNFNAYAGDVLQIALDGSKVRSVSGGLSGLKQTNDYPIAHATGDGNWMLFTVGDYKTVPPAHIMVAKLPPFSAQDSVDRTTFVRAPLTITPPAGQGIASATVEFGYTEQGLPNQYYCTSRREPCVATTSSVTDSNPFSYEQTDTYTKMPCTTSCTIMLPVLPMHVAYYQVKYYNAGGTLVANGDQGVAAESSVANINNLTVPTIATTYTLTPTSSSGNVGATSGVFTITPNATTSGTVTVTVTPSGSASAGLLPITKVFTNSNAGQTFTINPTVAGTVTLTPNSAGGLTDPAAVTYTVNAVVPGAPTGASAIAGNAQATVTFTAPASNGGSAITGYVVTTATAGGGATGSDSNTGSTSLSHVMTGLTNGHVYTFTVHATNVAGNSAESTATVGVTPTAPASAKAITAFSFTSPAVSGVVTEGTHTIAVNVPFGTNVTALVATFTTTGSSVAVGATPQVSGTTPNNFTSPVTYIVTAADASTQAYVVTVTVDAASTPAPSGGGGGSIFTPPTTPTPVTPKAIPGCDNGKNGFSSVSGISCINNITSVIPGCDNGKNGFSSVSGISCINNFTGTVTTPPTGSTTPTTTTGGKTFYDFGTTTLKLYSQGDAVKELQRFLNDKLNLGLKLDGKLGVKTIAVIKEWQKTHGLKVDGLIGPKTKILMNSLR